MTTPGRGRDLSGSWPAAGWLRLSLPFLGRPLSMCWQALGVTQASDVLFIFLLFFLFWERKIFVGLFVFAHFSDLEPLL